MNLRQRLAVGGPVVSDGATGTYLQARGLRPGECPEAMNASHPEVVGAMAADYFAAGSEMVLTNSFGANRFRLRQYGLDDRVVELNRRAAELARAAAPPGRFVVGSIGPTAELLEPLGDATEATMADAFAEQARALADAGVDGLVVETMSALEEAVLAVRAARAATDRVVMATMTFEKNPRGWRTSMGVAPEAAVAALLEAGAEVVGANCGSGAAGMVELAGLLRSLTPAPILIHANAGLPELVDGQAVYRETPETMLPHFLAMVGLGVRIVGGCCGTGPDHIRALADALRA